MRKITFLLIYVNKCCIFVNLPCLQQILFLKKSLTKVGFEPTPPERLEPKSSALDHSATLPCSEAPLECY